MSQPEQIEIHRGALYKQVWVTPISRLAPSFELSDNGLRKVCKKLHVPTPPRGYWAKLRHGHDVSPVLLPALPEDAPDVHVIYRGKVEREEAGARPKERGSGCASSELDVPPITVSLRLRAPHPLIVQTRDGLERPFTDQFGRIRPRGGIHLAIDPSSAHRALRILDVLLKQAERLGFEAGVAGERRKRKAYLALDGERVSFHLMEKLHRTEREDRDPDRPWRSRRWDYEPTGQLRIELVDARGHGAGRKQWSDGKRQRLEDLLASVLRGVYDAAQASKRWREELECWHRERKEAERRQREEQERRDAEQARRKDLEAQANRWTQSQTLTAYLDEVEQQAARRTRPPHEQQAYDAWITWARAHARRLDPLADGLPFDSMPGYPTGRGKQEC